MLYMVIFLAGCIFGAVGVVCWALGAANKNKENDDKKGFER